MALPFTCGPLECLSGRGFSGQMEIVGDGGLLPGKYRRCAVAVGNFDGVHVGHRALLSNVRERSRILGGPAVVYTFDPHPLKVLNPSACPPALTDFAQKAELLAELGIDLLVRARFDHEYAGREPGWFAGDVLGVELGASEVWIGPDFAFGRNRTGNVTTLREIGAVHGYEVCSFPPFLVDGVRVSSTRARRAVADRDFRLASRLLGRPFTLHGPVVHGVGRGAKIGFPTANVLTREECLPPPGVYAARARLDGAGEWLDAAVNIGANPTFGAAVLTVEAHLPGFSGDIYGKSMELRMVRAMRGEIAFASVDALIAHIGRDVEAVLGILREEEA